MPGKGKIDPYHNHVASDVRTILGERVTFYASDEREWYKVRDGSEVEFELAPVDPVKSETAKRMRREDSTTHRVFVFPLCTRSSPCAGTFWVSWREAWLKKDSRSFVLLNAGWTLFEGLPGDEDKVQVLRVDWDQLPHKGSKHAGHPHWHFDHELFISAAPDKVEVAPGLVEVTTDTAFAMARQASMGFIHLAMGAWNKDKDHPECWQRTYEEDCQQLHDWCVKTLRYLKEQVGGS
jgi:hypothetical protein